MIGSGGPDPNGPEPGGTGPNGKAPVAVPPEERGTGLHLPVPREVLTFATIGVGGLFVDMAALWAVMAAFGIGPHTAGFLSYFVAASFTWWANRQFNFQGASRRAALRQWITFLSANGVGAVVNLGVYNLLVGVGAPAFLVAGLPWLPALWPYGGKAAGSLAGMAFNFVLSKRLVFKGHKADLRGA